MTYYCTDLTNQPQIWALTANAQIRGFLVRSPRDLLAQVFIVGELYFWERNG